MLGIAYEPVLRGTAVITLLLAELKQLSSAVVGLVDSPVVEVGLVHNPEVEVVQQVDNLVGPVVDMVQTWYTTAQQQQILTYKGKFLYAQTL